MSINFNVIRAAIEYLHNHPDRDKFSLESAGYHETMDILSDPETMDAINQARWEDGPGIPWHEARERYLGPSPEDEGWNSGAGDHVPTDGRLDYCTCGVSWPCEQAEQE